MIKNVKFVISAVKEVLDLQEPKGIMGNTIRMFFSSVLGTFLFFLMIALNGHVRKFRVTADIKHDLKCKEVAVESEGIHFKER